MAEPETPLYLADWMIVIYIVAATLLCTLFYVCILCYRCMTSGKSGNRRQRNPNNPDTPRLMRETSMLPRVGKLIEDDVTIISETGQEIPAFWRKHLNNEEFLLDPLVPEQDEFCKVSALFMQTMPRCEIKRIVRIQNKVLWRKYMDRAKQMREYDQILGEMELFHGTRDHKPEDIYKGDSSFDMRFCQTGMWGRGNYFAVNASYSNDYAHKEGEVRQMLMAYVLTGHSYSCNSDSSLTKPPLREHQGTQDDGVVQRRYDSVCGNTNGSKVYITYDNDKAYPAYLISYTVP